MNKMLVPMFLPLLVMVVEMIIPVTARLNSVQAIKYRQPRKTKNGPPLCALDPANETTSSSSLKDCSVKCARDGICAGFNIKDSLACDVYNYKPKITELVSGCMFYQVIDYHFELWDFTLKRLVIG